jgi:hypothetical protein
MLWGRMQPRHGHIYLSKLTHCQLELIAAYPIMTYLTTFPQVHIDDLISSPHPHTPRSNCADRGPVAPKPRKSRADIVTASSLLRQGAIKLRPPSA